MSKTVGGEARHGCAKAMGVHGGDGLCGRCDREGKLSKWARKQEISRDRLPLGQHVAAKMHQGPALYTQQFDSIKIRTAARVRTHPRAQTLPLSRSP